MTSASIYQVPVGNANQIISSNGKSEGSAADFQKAMSKSLTLEQTQITDTAQTEVSAAKRKESTCSQSSVETEKSDTYKFEKKSEQVKTESPEEAKETVETAVSEFEEKVRKNLKDRFGLSDEEIDLALENLGFTMQDLMEPQNLTTFLGEITGTTESLNMLLDENVSEFLTETLDLVRDITTDLHMEPIEIKAILENSVDTEPVEMEELIDTMPTFEVISEEQPEVAFQSMTTEETTEILVENAEVEEVELPEIEMVISTASDEQPEEEVEVSTENSSQQTVVDDTEVTVVTSQTTDYESESEGNQKQETTGNAKILESSEEPTVEHTFTTTTFSQTVVQTESVSVTSYTSQIDVQRMITEIVDQAKVTLTEEVKTMEMVLNPEHLGKLFMEVSTKDGQVSARIYTENEAVKNALENQLVVLKENMNQQGVKIDAVEVSVGTHEFERNLEEEASHQERRDAELMQQEQEQQKKGRMTSIDLNQLDQLQGLMSEEDQLIAKIMKENGNTVNYMA